MTERSASTDWGCMRIREISESWGFTDSKVLPSSLPDQPGLKTSSMPKRRRAN
tara:strand:- start:429 stop:587 length:159 start_codon:yes stop_codon:yes gene_type:complete